jgi:phosphoribosylformylglycinamidine cyclo-ligase
MNPKGTGQDYLSAGVDVAAGDSLVEWLQQENAKDTASRKTPHQERIVEGIGGFASLFRAGFSDLKKPCLVTCTDGVGTKVKLASYFKSYEEVAQDCVAMCVNDLICTGGRPLLFLDYYATGKLDLAAAQPFLKGLRKACHEADCALVGGETAEMPGVYQVGDFDCAGFAVGVVDEDLALGARKVKSGDVLIGVSSSGFHSNGFSLLRKIFADDLDSHREDLLRPTALYVRLLQALQSKNLDLHAIAHITGGGVENIPRVLPQNLKWRPKWWKFPDLFLEVQKRTGLSNEVMRTTLNCGIGLVLVLPESQASQALNIIEAQGFEGFELGDLA